MLGSVVFPRVSPTFDSTWNQYGFFAAMPCTVRLVGGLCGCYYDRPCWHQREAYSGYLDPLTPRKNLGHILGRPCSCKILVIQLIREAQLVSSSDLAAPPCKHPQIKPVKRDVRHTRPDSLILNTVESTTVTIHRLHTIIFMIFRRAPTFARMHF